ncbi:MAG TPA: hypothetical protein VJX91_06705, partial [Candidatus Eisenbacteria bacterium]|nr:hypothetical protein [Candidatus Eisenbacteria bacterium]
MIRRLCGILIALTLLSPAAQAADTGTKEAAKAATAKEATAKEAAAKKAVPRSTATSVPITAASPVAWTAEPAPYHGHRDNITWGGEGELRFGYDVTAGVSDPSWFSVGRVNGFMEA